MVKDGNNKICCLGLEIFPCKVSSPRVGSRLAGTDSLAIHSYHHLKLFKTHRWSLAVFKALQKTTPPNSNRSLAKVPTTQAEISLAEDLLRRLLEEKRSLLESSLQLGSSGPQNPWGKDWTLKSGVLQSFTGKSRDLDMMKFSFCMAQGKDDSNGTPRVVITICFHMDDMDGYCHLEDHFE